MKNIFVIIFFTVFILVNSAQATIIEVQDFKGTFDSSTIGNLESYLININGDYPVPLGQFNVNELYEIQTNWRSTMLIDMLQRSFNPSAESLMDRTTYAEAWANYSSGFIYGHLEWWGNLNYGATQFYIRPIPDLSEYLINGLYVDSFLVQNDSTYDYDIKLLADVSPAPVPEPSTFILLAVGVAGIGFLRRMGNGKKVFLSYEPKKSI